MFFYIVIYVFGSLVLLAILIIPTFFKKEVRSEPVTQFLREPHSTKSIIISEMDDSLQFFIDSDSGNTAWEEYGSHGYGQDRDLAIFETSSSNTNLHSTGSTTQYDTWYHPTKHNGDDSHNAADTAEVDLERIVEEYYSIDYNNTIFGFKTTTT